MVHLQLAYQTTYFPQPDLKMIVLPLKAGSAPTLLAAPTGFQYPGRGGPPPLLPVPLPGTPYWLPPEVLWLGENGVTMPVPLVIDGVSGEFVNLERLTGLRSRVHAFFIRNFRLTVSGLPRA